MAPEDAFKILEMIANISGTRERLKMWPQSEEEKKKTMQMKLKSLHLIVIILSIVNLLLMARDIEVLLMNRVL